MKRSHADPFSPKHLCHTISYHILKTTFLLIFLSLSLTNTVLIHLVPRLLLTGTCYFHAFLLPSILYNEARIIPTLDFCSSALAPECSSYLSLTNIHESMEFTNSFPQANKALLTLFLFSILSSLPFFTRHQLQPH